jgi:hypothetical protein
MKFLDFNNVDQYACTDVNKQRAFQCYGIGTPCYFTIAAGNAPNAWVQLPPPSYTITKADF